MARTFARTRLVALIAALPLAMVLQTRARAQEPALEVFYTKLEPSESFKYKWKGKEGACNAGVFRWEVPQTEFGTNGLDRNFTGYCAEALVPITKNKLYRFRVNDIYAPGNYKVDGVDKDKVNDVANRRTKLVTELFGRYFRDPALKAVNPDDAVAFQIALWEIVQETEPAMGDLKLDLFAGDFQADYPKADAPIYVQRAQTFLDSLTGRDDALFYENPDLRGRELIRLQGIENADKVVAQSQFALRFKGGGAAGAGGAFSRALTAGGAGTGGGSGGGMGGGAGGLGNTGGGGGLFAGNPGGSGQTVPVGGGGTTTPPSTTPPTVTTPPVDGPDDPTDPTDPGNPGNPNPVPAPAGLLLGAIALGTVGTWRFGVRLLSAK